MAFRIILPKTHSGYQTENALLRDRLSAFTPPSWAELVIVAGDAADSSKATIKLVQQLDNTDRARAWYVVFAISRTWKPLDNQAVKDLVQHLPRCYYKWTWTPRLSTWPHCKTSWGYAKALCLRDIGDGTVVLSNTGHNGSPDKTKRLVTTLPHATARQVVERYHNRWSVEVITRDLQSAWGLGAHQVRGTRGRREKSFGMAVLAYWFVLRVCHHENPPGQPWRVSQLQHRLRLRVITTQVAHSIRRKLTPQCKVA